MPGDTAMFCDGGTALWGALVPFIALLLVFAIGVGIGVFATGS
jgi:hypothetical protein